MYLRTTCIALLLGLMACNGPQEKQIAETPEPPKALQEPSSEFSLKSARSKDDMVQELYAELLGKDASLKTLEEQLYKLRNSANDSTANFTFFNEKNKHYHSTTNGYISRISDSSLRQRIEYMLKNSLSRYETSIAAHQQLLRQIESNKTSLDDLYTAVKLVSTLRMMEKYRKDNMPAKTPMLNYILEQEKAKRAAAQVIQ